MTEREKLIEVMAQAVADSFTFERAQLSPEERRTIALTAALSAIERAGYVVCRKEVQAWMTKPWVAYPDDIFADENCIPLYRALEDA